MKTETARVPTVDMNEARKIANQLNINLSSALQIYYRKKYGNSKWVEF